MRFFRNPCRLALAALAVPLLWFAAPVVQQAYRRTHPPRSYSEAAVHNDPLLTLRGHTRRVNRAAFSPDGNRIASAGGDAADSGQEIVTFTGHIEKVRSVAFSPDGRFVATSGADEAVRFWDRTNAREVAVFSGQTAPAFSPDGKRLVTSGSDQTVNVWNVAEMMGPEPTTGKRER